MRSIFNKSLKKNYFIIKEEIEHGLEGFVNLVGIESPGLTSSLAIAEMVDEILSDK